MSPKPKLPPGESLTAELRIRMKRADRELLDDAAGDYEWTSTWAREVLLDAARRRSAKR